MDIEQQLKERYGTDSHFIIPDNYLESFESKILSQTTQAASATSDKPHPSLWQRLRPLVVAASFVGICGLSGVILTKFVSLSKQEDQPHQAQSTQKTTTTVDPVDQLADYAMLDDDDVYAILADN